MSWVMVSHCTQWLTANDKSFYCGVSNLRLRTFWSLRPEAAQLFGFTPTLEIFHGPRRPTTEWPSDAAAFLSPFIKKLRHNVTPLLHKISAALGITHATVWKHPGRLIAHITMLSKPVPQTNSCSNTNMLLISVTVRRQSNMLQTSNHIHPDWLTTKERVGH